MFEYCLTKLVLKYFTETPNIMKKNWSNLKFNRFAYLKKKQYLHNILFYQFMKNITHMIYNNFSNSMFYTLDIIK